MMMMPHDAVQFVMTFAMFLMLVLLLLPSLVIAQAPLTGDVSAVYDLLDRVLPKSQAQTISI